MGIEKMLVDTAQNEELERYIDERQYETASLGETSADELALREQTASDLSDTEIDIYRTDEISSSYQKAQKLSNAIKDYETELVHEHLKLDIYRAKGKSRSKISFNDLTLQENLNYIKYTLKDSNEAFDLFKVTKDTFTAKSPEIPAALVQKLANKTKDLDRKIEIRDKIVRRPEYKQMLKSIKQGLPSLDNRQLVDTLFSLGKLHKMPIEAEVAEQSRLFPFLNHLVNDFLAEAQARLD